MSNETNLNSYIPQVSSLTKINQELVIAGINGAKKISTGTVLCDKYVVETKLNASGGEADLYICDYNGNKYIAKVYGRKNAIKEEVINKLKQIDSPYVAKLYETGKINEMPFEILPYYKNGSVQGKKFTFEELKSIIIPCINEGIRALHDKDIIHKDLKPSNIMLNDDGKGVSIIDFGISSVLQDGNTVLVTKTGMTPEYSAPETQGLGAVWVEMSDYYSFGITLYELFFGELPYANMSDEDKIRMSRVQKIPIPSNVPKELADLIHALTYDDITNRKNKDNPNRRWTYEEVKKWCEGIKQIIPGEGTEKLQTNMQIYQFNDKEFTDIHSLVYELVACWDEGKKELFRGRLAPHFANSSKQNWARICSDAEEGNTRDPASEDLIFWKTMYKLSPKLNAFCWKGIRFDSLSELGQDMLDKLFKNDKSYYEYYNDILEKKLLSEYIALKFPNDEKRKNAVDNIERKYKINTQFPEKNYYTMAYILAEQKIFFFENEKFRSPGELSFYISNLPDNQFRAYCQKLIDDNSNLNIAFECWLKALGKDAGIELWKNNGKSTKI